LRDRGYRTGAFSGNYFFVTRRQGFARGFIHFEDYFTTLADMAVRTVYGRDLQRWLIRRFTEDNLPARKIAADITNASLRWLDHDSRRPFFLFLNYFDAHAPYLPPQPYRGRFSRLKNPGGAINEFRRYPKLTPERFQGEIDAYDGGIAYIDDMIGRLLAGLQQRQLSRNTMIVFLSDHGEHFGERGFLMHCNSLYAAVLHVPLIVHWPGRIPPGARIAQPVSIAGIPTTVLDLLGDSKQKLFPGPSLARLWTNAEEARHWPEPFAELTQMRYPLMERYPLYYGWLKSLIGPRYYFIRHQKLGDEIYDRTTDSTQSKNLIDTMAGQQAQAQYDALLRRLEVDARPEHADAMAKK